MYLALNEAEASIHWLRERRVCESSAIATLFRFRIDAAEPHSPIILAIRGLLLLRSSNPLDLTSIDAPPSIRA